MKLIAFIFFLSTAAFGQLQTPFEKSKGNYSASYEEAIAYYQKLDSLSGKLEVQEWGPTDIGRPLHLVVISGNGLFTPAASEGKIVVLINNAIHPGESCGVDASIQFARDLITNADYARLLDKITFCIIPIYNVGGSLNRSCCTRANQNGPELQGFRGNGRLLDLNRDFIKADSKNALSFAKIFRTWNPHFFIDTHTSDGADYPAVLTLIATQRNKLNPILSDYLYSHLEPKIYSAMNDKEGIETCPYVNQVAGIPDSGISDFMESPRYSTGYASLFDCIGFTTEAHMLKPFSQRVEATYAFFRQLATLIGEDVENIKSTFAAARKLTHGQVLYPINWNLNMSKYDTLVFHGYTAETIISPVTGMPRVHYNRDKPFKKSIKYFREYTSNLSIIKPVAYIIPQGWHEVIERMKANQVEMHVLWEDVLMEVEVYYIREYETTTFAYEGHYVHYNTKVEKEVRDIQYFAGDVVVYLNQAANRFLVETLEPESVDSYFNWNFFDEILMQKEYFSSYIFDELANSILLNSQQIKEEFELKKKTDPEFAGNARAQLDFIYKRSAFHEDSHLRYPVSRLMKDKPLPID